MLIVQMIKLYYWDQVRTWFFPGFFLGFPRYLPYILRSCERIEKDAKHQVKSSWGGKPQLSVAAFRRMVFPR